MKRIIRDRKLTSAEAAKYDAVRRKISHELPSLKRRHKQRAKLSDELQRLMVELKGERKKRRISLADMTHRTGMDRAAISRLETGKRENPTIDTLLRYAQAVGKRVVLTVSD